MKKTTNSLAICFVVWIYSWKRIAVEYRTRLLYLLYVTYQVLRLAFETLAKSLKTIGRKLHDQYSRYCRLPDDVVEAGEILQIEHISDIQTAMFNDDSCTNVTESLCKLLGVKSIWNACALIDALHFIHGAVPKDGNSELLVMMITSGQMQTSVVTTKIRFSPTENYDEPAYIAIALCK